MEDHETPSSGDAEARKDYSNQEAGNLSEENAAGEQETRKADSGLEFRQRRAEMLRGSIEHREFAVDGMECRALDDGTVRMNGIASVTERFYEVGDPERGGFREKIARNSFRRTLGEQPDVSLLGNHEGWPMARTTNGSLVLEENARGLAWTADLDSEDPESVAVSRKVERGLIDQCSFAFRATSDSWNEEYTERTITGVSLHRGDVSLVTQGANEATSVSVLRSADGLVELRAGKAISSANEDALRRVLDLVASADEAVDEAQPILAGVLGVDNPDADDAEPDADDEGRAGDVEQESRVVYLPSDMKRYRQRLAVLRGGRR